MWANYTTFNSKNYKCGYCGSDISSNSGYSGSYAGIPTYICICHKCDQPTYFDSKGKQTPGSLFGNTVSNIDDQTVLALYEEARKCTTLAAYTASVMCCRKLLMHIAVSKGAKPGLSFKDYVDYLNQNHFTPPNSNDWVDHIRNKGNEQNHEIVFATKEEAEEIITFSEMLLKYIYEFPNLMKQKYSKTPPSP